MDQHLDRICGSCTMCCQGWLYGEAYGHTFYPGKPCHFVCKDGCSIYEKRPENPCRLYKCAWKTDNFFPEWFRPDISDVICTWIKWKENEFYLEVVECGKKLDSKILSWLFINHINGFLPNFKYTLDGGVNFVGSNEFLCHMGVRENDI